MRNVIRENAPRESGGALQKPHVRKFQQSVEQMGRLCRDLKRVLLRLSEMVWGDVLEGGWDTEIEWGGVRLSEIE